MWYTNKQTNKQTNKNTCEKSTEVVPAVSKLTPEEPVLTGGTCSEYLHSESYEYVCNTELVAVAN
jgi:hypothetical protein